MRSCFLTIFFLLSLTSFLFGQQTPPVRSEQFRQIDSLVTQDVPAGGPGIATGIVKNGRVIYIKYAGYADLSDSTLINESSRFNIASNAKQFTALAVLLLADQKKLSLEDDIRKFLPELYSGLKFKISIKNLLNHSSGIRDVYELWNLQNITWWKTTLNNQDALSLLQKQKELNFKPGEKYLYSNSNYILLAQIIEKVTGESFVNYTKKLFVKLGMLHTTFVENHNQIQGPVAKPYFNFDRWVNYNWLCDIHGDGNLFTTLVDQLTWEKIIQTGHHDILPAGLIRRTQQLIEKSGISAYGYGLEFGVHRGIPFTFHEGATGAWKATLIRFPADSLSLLTFTNSGKTIPADQTRQMADVLLGSKVKKSTYLVKPERPGAFLSTADILGIYLDETDFGFQFEERDTSLFLLRFGRNDIQLVRESANIFHQMNDPAFKQEFKKDSTGKLHVTAYYPSHSPYTLARTENDWRKFDFERIDRTYLNEETNQSLSIKYISGQKFDVKLGDSNHNGILVTPAKMLCDGFQLEIIYSPSASTVFLDANRIKKVRFTLVK